MVTGLLSEADSCPNPNIWFSDNNPIGGLFSEYNCTSACEHLTRIIEGTTIVRRVGMRIWAVICKDSHITFW